MLTRRDLREQRQRADTGPTPQVPTESTIEPTPEVPSESSVPEASADPVRVLVVCTGNVIRSALAERALRQQFALIGADRVEVTSAGTRAAVGQGMWRESVEIARAYGFDYRDFVARQLDDEALAGADLVIAAAREHRESVLRRRPALLHRTFTFREFVRILDGGVPPLAGGGTAPGAAAARLVDLASWADRQRVAHRAADPLDDDLLDPRDAGREALWTFERDLIRGVVTIVRAVSGEAATTGSVG